ncbi:hypothetical protein KUTeg_008555 [Tegillarca granosa]|uniref:Uncharacterized protein n=1 Tax=Tegillarca granosa TaxID=220873 RepID=A0ABQ9F9I2_TEGGR|nr:hypothetical protein KUTeg_008555 [Tegillarca granosa]
MFYKSLYIEYSYEYVCVAMKSIDEVVWKLLLSFYVLSHSMILNDTPEMHTKCLEQRTYEWDMRAAVKCDKLESYHCLEDFSDSKQFHELCRKFMYISPGNYPVYSPTSKTIHQRSCPNNTYQDRLIKSSDLNSCVMKTECTGMGSLVCNNGSTSEDRRCKCDIKKEMVITAYGEKDFNTDICCPDIDPGSFQAKNQTVSATTKEGEESTYIGDIIIEGAPSQSISINYQGDHKGDSYTVKNSKNIAIGKKATLEVKSNPPTSLLKRDLNASETELECFKAHFDSLETDAKCVDEETTFLKRELNTQETELKCS